MVCSLAVPALAADDSFNVQVTVIDETGTAIVEESVKLYPKTANVEKALSGKKVTINSAGAITKLNGKAVTSTAIIGEFGTGVVVVAVNGKAVTDDLGTVTLKEDDKVTVYWADTTLGTKLSLVDTSKLSEGIVSLYYYDAEGNRQPLTDAFFSLKNGEEFMVNALSENKNDTTFVTDEKGQIWIAPEYLDGAATWTIGLVEGETSILEPIAVKDSDKYTEAEELYVESHSTFNVEDYYTIGATVKVKSDLYNTAGATGDMTMVYVLVAAAAVVTLAAVVVLKKKSVKAN
jgi:sulfur carrier protein ThiS